MKLGVYLPTGLPSDLTGTRVIEWARLADHAGFHVLATLDRPNYDLWDGLATLAGMATVTNRIRLSTLTLQLPSRNEVLVAKQAAVIDRLSDGRFELGLSLGGRRDDYDALGAPWEGRIDRFGRQVATIRDIWSKARASTEEVGVLGPAPVQEPGSPDLDGRLCADRDRACDRARRWLLFRWQQVPAGHRDRYQHHPRAGGAGGEGTVRHLLHVVRRDR